MPATTTLSFFLSPSLSLSLSLSIVVYVFIFNGRGARGENTRRRTEGNVPLLCSSERRVNIKYFSGPVQTRPSQKLMADVSCVLLSQPWFSQARRDKRKPRNSHLAGYEFFEIAAIIFENSELLDSKKVQRLSESWKWWKDIFDLVEEALQFWRSRRFETLATSDFVIQKAPNCLWNFFVSGKLSSSLLLYLV